MAFVCYSLVLASLAAAHEWPDAVCLVAFLVVARLVLR